jgi:hypothetical protein
MVSLLLGVIAASALVGCAGEGRPPGGGPAGTPPAAASSTAPPITDIPDAAFLQPQDLGDGHFVPNGLSSYAVAPCYKAGLRSDAQRAHREEVVGVYKFSGRPVQQPDGIVNQNITAYRQGGAAAYMAEVREQIAQCPSTLLESGEVTYETSILGRASAGTNRCSGSASRSTTPAVYTTRIVNS